MARMEDHRIPKQMLFGHLLQPHPAQWCKDVLERSCEERFEEV